MSRCTTCRRERGAVLLTAVVVTCLATMLVMGLAHEAALRLEGRQLLRYGGTALAIAQAGLEAGARKASASSTWRADPTTWLAQRALGDGTVTVAASDPADGHVEVNGAIGSSSADGVRLTATATVSGLTRVLRADYLPLPHAGAGQRGLLADLCPPAGGERRGPRARQRRRARLRRGERARRHHDPHRGDRLLPPSTTATPTSSTPRARSASRRSTSPGSRRPGSGSSLPIDAHDQQHA